MDGPSLACAAHSLSLTQQHKSQIAKRVGLFAIRMPDVTRATRMQSEGKSVVSIARANRRDERG